MLPGPQIRTLALALADSPAWNELVRPEFDRQIRDYESAILTNSSLDDRALADHRTRYHAVQRLLQELHSQVMSSLTSLTAEEQLVFSPAMHQKLSNVFALHSTAPAALPAPAPIQDPIAFPSTPTFNPYSSPPPSESTAVNNGQPS
jgi:hypothetical protein